MPRAAPLKTQHRFGDDVALDLVRSAVDAELACVQVFLRGGVAVVRARHEMIGADRMLANRKTIVADGLVCQIGDALEDLGAADLEQRSDRSGVDSTGHLRNDAKLSCLQRKHIEFDARDLPDEFTKGRIVGGDLRLYDLFEAVPIVRGAANSGHGGALDAARKLRL